MGHGSQRLRLCRAPRKSKFSFQRLQRSQEYERGKHPLGGGHDRPSENILTKWWCPEPTCWLEEKWMVEKRIKQLQLKKETNINSRERQD